MNCGFCGSTNPSIAKFCFQCGRPFAIAYHNAVQRMPASYAGSYAGSAAPVIDATPRPKRKPTSWKRVIVITVLAVGIGLGLSKLFFAGWNRAATEPDRRMQAQFEAEAKIRRGLLMTAVQPSSAAERSGILPQDIIIRYGNSTIEDITTYVAAADAQPSTEWVRLTVFRGGAEKQLRVPPGYLGFQYEDWNPTRKLIYQRFANRDLAGAAELAAVAEREQSLTEVQALIIKIMLISDRCSREDDEKRSELMAKLLTVYPMIHLCTLATAEFMNLRSYKAAVMCYEYQLEEFDEDDVNARLNLAACYERLFEFDKAERTVNYELERPRSRLSAFGLSYAHQVLGGVALGRHQYRDALHHFLPYLEKGDDYAIFMSLLAAARLGDLKEFDQIEKRAVEVAPEKVRKSRFYVDMLKAYAISEKGSRHEAAALVLKWGSPQCVVETSSSYWDNMPGADGVTDRMRVLVGLNTATDTASVSR